VLLVLAPTITSARRTIPLWPWSGSGTIDAGSPVSFTLSLECLPLHDSCRIVLYSAKGKSGNGVAPAACRPKGTA
jgi:hypothetical protein